MCSMHICEYSRWARAVHIPYTENILSNISNTRDSVSSGYPNTEKRVENTACSGVFLTEFEVFGWPM